MPLEDEHSRSTRAFVGDPTTRGMVDVRGGWFRARGVQWILGELARECSFVDLPRAIRRISSVAARTPAAPLPFFPSVSVHQLNVPPAAGRRLNERRRF